MPHFARRGSAALAQDEVEDGVIEGIDLGRNGSEIGGGGGRQPGQELGGELGKERLHLVRRSALEALIEGTVGDLEAGKIPEAVQREQPPTVALRRQTAQQADEEAGPEGEDGEHGRADGATHGWRGGVRREGGRLQELPQERFQFLRLGERARGRGRRGFSHTRTVGT